MASIDPNCKSAETRSCKNYNYLAIDSEWWTLTGDSSDNSSVYMIDRNGIVKSNNASNYAALRPVVYLNSNVMFNKGNGSLEKPYTFR
jgi:hypothetical protein